MIRASSFKNRVLKAFTVMIAVVIVTTGCSLKSIGSAEGKRQMEKLDRGLVAVKTDDGVFVSWRMFGTESEDISFNVYRDGKKVNSKSVTSSTNYLDSEGTVDSEYQVYAVLKGKEQKNDEKAAVWDKDYLAIPLQKPADGKNADGSAYTYSANDASAGDLDGDGKYEIILKWDPDNSKDNSQDGVTGEVYLDAYKLDGAHMWRIALGKNIRAGAHYTQFMVYDLDGDGKAEVACKTADGTTDAKGKVIGDVSADYRNSKGFIVSGPEYLTIFDGMTGGALTTVDYEPPRGDINAWGKANDKGNRVDRFLAAIAYLDGKRPSLVMCRGYYGRTVLVAYNWREGKLEKLWTFDSTDAENPKNAVYAGQGNHSLSVADVDNDGKDEIIYGACAIDNDGKGLYNTKLGHGDAMHLGDLDPDRPGLEVFQVHEDKASPASVEFRDAATGELIWGEAKKKDVGRGLAADVDPRYKGEEAWADKVMYDVKGNKIGYTTPSVNFAIWWDGDLLRELLDSNVISKWDPSTGNAVPVLTAKDCVSNNSTKATPSLQADILGDWREEAVWRNNANTELRIYTTTALTERKIYTLMHDPVYRMGIAWQNVAYNQPPHTGFYLGQDMETAPKPDIYLAK